VIFLPLVFVQGVTGILFKETGLCDHLFSHLFLAVSLTLVPMLASRLLKSNLTLREKRKTWVEKLMAFSNAFFLGLDNAYLKLLGTVLRHRLFTILVALLLLGGSLLLLPFIGSEFIPPSDEGEVRVSGKMKIGTRLELVDQQTRKMEKIVYPAVPEAVASVVSVGASGWRPNSGGEGQIILSLVPAARRNRSNVEIAADLRRRLKDRIPGMEIRVRAPQGQFLLERLLGGDEGLTIEVRGYDLKVLGALVKRVAEIKDVPGITDIDTSLEEGVPQEEIRIDRSKIADLDLTVRDVTQLLETAVAGSKAGEYRTGGNSYRILVQLKDAQKRSLDEILNLTLTSGSGEQVALRNLVITETGRGPLLIDRKDQQRLFTVQANVAGRDLGSVAREVQARLNRIPRAMGYDLMVAGNFEEQQKAFRELAVSIVLALVLVYMVLACQYESLRDPLVVMFSVPLAAVGVLLTLFITKTTLNVQSYIGCIMLGGIVVNNAVLLVDQAGQLLRTGMETEAALTEAGRRRLRPILMTTLTTILGLLPLALGIGEGADAQAPLARAVVGGLTGSTLITLVLIPAVYSLFHPVPVDEASFFEVQSQCLAFDICDRPPSPTGSSRSENR
jgi:HAE1 family hydrophobic/amphiphilic exporter-1